METNVSSLKNVALCVRTRKPAADPNEQQVSSGFRVTRSLVLCICFVDR
jgi:hypothetical protein